ncbi:MAG TPA: phosphatase PAP2 family protein [Firmicutes bacterium]|nr:phosphatase PAP2 family protein [Bacillota bacterium]
MHKSERICMIALPVAAVLLLALMVTGVFGGVETAAYGFAASLHSPAMTAFMRVITELGGAIPVILLCLVLLIWPAARWRCGIPVSAAALLSVVLNQILKQLVQRARPDVLRLSPAEGYSFPSGHSMNNAVVYLLLLFLLWPILQKAWQRAAAAIGFCLLPLLVGFSRMYLGVHYLGDILFGWLLGAWIAVLISVLWRRCGERIHARAAAAWQRHVKKQKK